MFGYISKQKKIGIYAFAFSIDCALDMWVVLGEDDLSQYETSGYRYDTSIDSFHIVKGFDFSWFSFCYELLHVGLNFHDTLQPYTYLEIIPVKVGILDDRLIPPFLMLFVICVFVFFCMILIILFLRFI
jgi:hypothetical protein